MSVSNTQFKYALPRAEEYLRIVSDNMVGNLRAGNAAKLNLMPLVQRAYILVNELGVLPYRDYDAADVFLGDV
jgi:hypothetical protein